MIDLELLFSGVIVFAIATLCTFLISEILENKFRNNHKI